MNSRIGERLPQPFGPEVEVEEQLAPLAQSTSSFIRIMSLICLAALSLTFFISSALLLLALTAPHILRRYARSSIG